MKPLSHFLPGLTQKGAPQEGAPDQTYHRADGDNFYKYHDISFPFYYSYSIKQAKINKAVPYFHKTREDFERQKKHAKKNKRRGQGLFNPVHG